MDVDNLKRDETPIHFFNPLKENVEIEIYDDQNHINLYILPALEISTYPKYLADILRKHLIDAIINERKIGMISSEKRLEIAKETEVQL